MSRLVSLIDATQRPATVSSLTEDLQRLGVSSGMTVAVHASLSSLGYVVGGAQAVVEALMQVVGNGGTVAMPSHSGDLSDPAPWQNPAVPPEWHDILRKEMPPFNASLTPTRGMGAVVECFRSHSLTVRSQHPTVSWCACGPNARVITEHHSLGMSQGEESPLARLYDLDATVLLLGVGFDRNTSFHLAEHRTPGRESRHFVAASPILENGIRQWVEYDDLLGRETEFSEIGESFERVSKSLRRGLIGAATTRAFSLREGVDFAVDWFTRT